MKAFFSYAELAELTGEVLPERAVLSTIVTGVGGDSYNNNNDGHGHDGFNGGGSSMQSNACSSTKTYPDGGLLQLVGLHADHQTDSLTCVPGQQLSGH